MQVHLVLECTFFLALPTTSCRMREKIQSVVDELTEIGNKVDAAYSAGVVDGFNKEHGPK